MTENQSTTNTAAAKHQYDAPLAAVLARLQDRWAREDEYPQIQQIAQLAVALRWARESIAALLDLADADRRAPVLPDDPDGYAIRWGELARDLSAWDYQLEGSESLLDGEFTNLVSAAREEWAADEGGDDLADEPADVPVVAELPPAKGRPYWEGGR